MSTITTINTRMTQKHATAAEWASSTLIPMLGEIVVYDSDDTKTPARTKIGDGVTPVGELPFIDRFPYEEYNLPVLKLTGDMTGISKDDKVNLSFTYLDIKPKVSGDTIGKEVNGGVIIQTNISINNKTYSRICYTGDCTLKWQGSSSIKYPKKNYTLKLKEQSFEAVEGWGAQDKYCLKANYIDFSHARNVVSAKLWGQAVKSRANSSPMTDRALVNGGAVDGFPICLVINDEYQGLYTFNIPKDGWMAGMGEGDAECIVASESATYPTNFSGRTGLNGKLIRIDYTEVSNKSNATNIYGKMSIDSENKLITAIEGNTRYTYTYEPAETGSNFTVNSETSVTVGAGKITITTTDNTTGDTLASAKVFEILKSTVVEQENFSVEYNSDNITEEDVFTSLNTLISNVLSSYKNPDKDISNITNLDWDSAIDYYILVMLLNHKDGTGKNYLLFNYGVDTSDDMWYFSAYDMDSTYGLHTNGAYFDKIDYMIDSIGKGNNIFNLIEENDTLRAKLLSRYKQLRNSVFSTSNVIKTFEDFIGSIPKKLYDKEVEIWKDIPSSETNNLTQISDYFIHRCEIIDKKMDALNVYPQLINPLFPQDEKVAFMGDNLSGAAKESDSLPGKVAYYLQTADFYNCTFDNSTVAEVEKIAESAFSLSKLANDTLEYIYYQENPKIDIYGDILEYIPFKEQYDAIYAKDEETGEYIIETVDNAGRIKYKLKEGVSVDLEDKLHNLLKLSTYDKDANGNITTLPFATLDKLVVSTGKNDWLNEVPLTDEQLDQTPEDETNISQETVILDSITVTAPTKTTYIVGDTLDTAGMVVTANYSDGTSIDVTNAVYIDVTTIAAAGTERITVIYKNKTASFTVTVTQMEISEKNYINGDNTQIWWKCIPIDESDLTLGYRLIVGKDTGAVSMPDGVDSSGNSVILPWFDTSNGGISKDSLKTLIITNGVRSIGKYTFNNCINLENVAVGANITKQISNSAFAGCINLNTISIPNNSATNLNTGAFSGCTSLTSISIPGSVQNIYEKAFENCSNLISVFIQDGVKSIGRSAFNGCENLTNLMLPSSITTITEYAFYNCKKLTDVVIPDSVTAIGNYGFYGCESLDSVVIGNSITNIETKTFMGCTSLTNLNIGNSVASIGESAFNSCTNLKNLVIPDNVTTIGNNAFEGCTSLNNVIIGSGTESISEYAFRSCTSLRKITIPNNITTISRKAFAESGLEFVIVMSGENNVTLGEGVFHTCSHLISITLPDNVTSIGDYTFYDCPDVTIYGYSGIVDSETQVYTPTCAEAYAEANGITFKADVIKGTNLHWNFDNTTKTLTVSGVGAMPDWENLDNNRAPWYNKAKSILTLIIQDGITNIGNFAFYACGYLTKVSIPNSVAHIGNSAFQNCSRLPAINLSDNITHIGSSAFLGCTKLTSIVLPNQLTNIYSYTFRDCTSLISITIPDSITNIHSTAFYHKDINSDLQNIVIYGYSSSAAETYAKDKNIKFVYLAPTILNTNTITYTGALNYFIKKIQTKFPNLQIYLVSSPFSTSENYLNDNGNILREFAEASIQCAQTSNIQAVDLYKNLGINSYNCAAFYNDSYLNEQGCDRAGRFIAGAIRG